MNLITTIPRQAGTALRFLAAIACAAVFGAAVAATTDIGTAPLFTSSNNAVKPNIMFILDDSGSMAWDFLPDAANMGSSKYAKFTSQCNGVAYNPTTTYPLPVDATGATLAPGSLGFITFNPTTQTANTRTLTAITAMPTDATGTFTVHVTSTGKSTASWYSSPLTPALGPPSTVTVFQQGDPSRYFVGTVTKWDTPTMNLTIDLTGSPIVSDGGALNPARIGDGQPSGSTYYRYTGSQPRMSYTYTSGGVITTTTFYRECASTIGSSPGSGVFTPVVVTSLSAEAQNYANWYQYYRVRMSMMKSSVSLAFKGIDSRYRLGYSTISATTASEATESLGTGIADFLNIRDFDSTQKAQFYADFNAATTAHYTPLRGSLSKAGQYFANKADSQTVDPVQYSCQRNFTILSTDGYWNTPEESTSSPKYGPYQLNNTTNVGQQDGSGTLRPMLDGNTVTTTTTSTWTVTVVTGTTTVTPVSTVTTQTKTTSTYTPVSGQAQSTYTLPTKQVPATISRPSGSTPYWVTVATSGPLNLGPPGTTATFVVTQTAGTGVSGYTGTVKITVIDSTHFQYTATTGSRPSSPSTASNYTVGPSTAQSCSVGQGQAIKTVQTRDQLNFAISTSTTTSSTVGTVTLVTTKTDKTPYTEVVTQTDGVTTNHTGPTQGALVSTPFTTTTSVSSAVTTTTNITASTGPGSVTDWVTASTSTVLGCTSTVPTTTTVANATTTSVVKITAGPTTTGPTTTSGTAVVTTTGPTTTTSAVTVVSSSSSTGGVSDSLADVAAYYYKTDLRNAGLSNCTGALGSDVCTDNVPGSTADAAHSYGDSATWQHMTTFTLGLGLSGLLQYDPNYLTQTSGDFHDIVTGVKNWPAPGPSASAENVDDLWHTAVNGHGQYFSAGDPTALANSLTSALNSIKAVTGAAAAASTSSLQPVQGDNDIYVAEFTTQEWVGDVLSFKIDPASGAISTTATWSAKTQLDAATPSARTIYYPNPSGASTLRAFTYTNLNTDGYSGNFDGFCSKTAADGSSSPAQCSGLSSADRNAANLGTNLVAYLRGDQTLTYYRTRTHRLGDIISASPLFVGKPSFKYLDAGYSTYQSDNASRTAVVLAAANDGMLHAFDRLTGNELWAYVPSFVLPKMYKLADTGYANNHSYYVDGSPQIGDIKVGGVWKTIVVGGLNAGGRGYYALDVTDATAPKLLWEFSDNNLGLTFGNPIITKRSDGTWVVVFGSGYNNVSPGDGNGHLYVLNANTGAVLRTLDTNTAGGSPVGSTSTPSGLAKINDWVDSETNNLALRYYGGDLLGNLWRFDVDDLVAPNHTALQLAQFKIGGTTPQSITVRPALAVVTYNGVDYPVVFTATGRYLGTTDLTTTTTQSIYAIKDPLTNSPYGDIRSTNVLVTQTLSIGTDANGNPTRSIVSQTVTWSAKAGWRTDFPAAGERVNIDPQLALSTLFIGTNVPKSDACNAGGQSFLYKFDIATGSTAVGESSIGTYVGNVLLQGLTLVQLTDGTEETILTRSDASLQTNQSSGSGGAGTLHRTSWRELVN